jgi:hypothetical protein
MSLLVLSVAALATTLPCIALWLSESTTTVRSRGI